MEQRVIIPMYKLEKMYYKEKKSTNEIAKILFCSNTTVLKNMKSYNMERRKISKALSLKYNLKAGEIKDLINYNCYQKEIAKLYDCHTSTICVAIKRFKERGEW